MADILIVVKVEGVANANAAIASLNSRVSSVSQASASAKSNVDRIANAMTSTTAVAIAARSAFAPLLAVMGGTSVIGTANQYELFSQRLDLVTDQLGGMVDAERGLFEASQKTGTSFKDNLEIFSRMGLNAATIGIGGNEILQITENLNKLIVLSGANAKEAKSAIIQLSQGFASGQVRGEELRSVMEQLPAVALAVAKKLGLTVGQFRDLSFEGKIAAEDFANALLASTGEIDDKFLTIEDTAGRAWQRLKNALFQMTGRFFKVTGLLQSITDALNHFAGIVGNLSRFTKMVGKFGDLGVAELISAAAAISGTILVELSALFVESLEEKLGAFAGIFNFLFGDDIKERLANLRATIMGGAAVLREEVDPQTLHFFVFAPAELTKLEEARAKEKNAAQEAADLQAQAEKNLVDTKKRLQEEASRIANKQAEDQAKIAAAAIKEADQLEADRLEFLVRTNNITLEEYRALWRIRLEATKANSRAQLEALEELADINETIASKVIESVSFMTPEQQVERLRYVKSSYEEQASTMSFGAERFNLAIDAINEALKTLTKELDDNKLRTQRFADDFRNSFSSGPTFAFGVIDGLRSTMRGFVHDVFTGAKSLGKSLKDALKTLKDRILGQFAVLLADQLLGLVLGKAGGISGVVSNLLKGGDEGKGLGDLLNFKEFDIGSFFRPDATAIGTAGVGLVFSLLGGGDPFEALGGSLGGAIGGLLAGPVGSVIGNFVGGKLLSPILDNIFGGDPHAPVEIDPDSSEIKETASYKFLGRNPVRSRSTAHYSFAGQLADEITAVMRERGYQSHEIPAFGTASRIPRVRQLVGSKVQYVLLDPELLFRIGLSGNYRVLRSSNVKSLLRGGGNFGAGHGILTSGSLRDAAEFAADLLEPEAGRQRETRRVSQQEGIQPTGITARTAFAMGDNGKMDRWQLDGSRGWPAHNAWLAMAGVLQDMSNLGWSWQEIPPFSTAIDFSASLQQRVVIGRNLFKLGAPTGVWSPFRNQGFLRQFAVRQLLAIGKINRPEGGRHSRANATSTLDRLKSGVFIDSGIAIKTNEPIMMSENDVNRFARYVVDQIEAA